MRKILIRLLENELAVTGIEYGLIAALIVVVAVVVMDTVGTSAFSYLT